MSNENNNIPNSEILFIYDAEKTNPNGDMDDDNKPRMDKDTNTNLVSDVRLKRYVRDYFEKYEDEELFITESAKDSKDRNKQIKKDNGKHTDLIDVRLFGAVFADSGANTHLTGPVQFNWGYSLNEVELQESKTITSSFSSGQGIGKDYRVKYSIISFSGGINGLNAKHTQLTEEDITSFDNAMVKSIPLLRTRSKIGQTPRLYLRVVLKDNKNALDDLREYIELEKKEGLTDIHDVNLNMSNLSNYLTANKDKIGKIIYWKHPNLKITGFDPKSIKNKNGSSIELKELDI